MIRVLLTGTVARSIRLCGVLLLGFLVQEASSDDSATRKSVRPARELPFDDIEMGLERTIDPFPFVHSPTTKKLVLVGAEIDAHADQPHVAQVEKGTSSRKARKTAADELPQQHLNQQQRQAVAEVLNSVSVFRRLPAFQCQLDPRVHDYFIQHPDVAASIWRAMAISCLQMTQQHASQYNIDTLDGTTGVVQVLYQSRESCLVQCDGMFKSPYLKDAIQAKALMHLKTGFSSDQEGRIYATHQADLFVSFPSQKVETIAKLISPVSNSIIDRNFQEISLFIHVMWLAMTKQPGWVEQIAGRLEGVAPQRKEELIKLTAEVYVTNQTELRKRTGLPVSAESVRPARESRPLRSAASPPIDVTR
ncbi:MAG: hypothetical protein KF861_01025 [Planctomycetaceae bacterium]|nr:hypothetical protein [Planctomycetaceae bacterium]